jgi:HD superfamily phosphohydrolase
MIPPGPYFRGGVPDLVRDLTRDIPELRSYPQATLRLPELTNIPLTDRVRRLIGHPHFQRLRHVRQLGLTHWVYPGATHTRLEHSLGVFSNAIHYVSALLADQTSSFFRDTVTPADLQGVLVAALLHDLGQYPFAHAFENSWPGLPGHEEYTLWFVTGESTDRIPALPPAAVALPDLIERDWGVDPQDVAAVLCRAVPPVTLAEPQRSILHSIIDSPVDADKMDYLVRDSIHTGVYYGRFLDVDRFLQCLTLDPATHSTLALAEKGRICAELFLVCRYAMFSEVYWHHTVRSLSTMLTHAVRQMAQPGADLTDLYNVLFTHSDDEVLRWLVEHGPEDTRALVSDILDRVVYKRLLVYRSDERDESLYNALSRLRWEEPEERFRAFCTALRENLGRAYGVALRERELLLDIPDPHKDRLASVSVIPEHRREAEELATVSHLWAAVGQDFPRWVRKVRVFSHPKHVPTLLSRGPDYLDRLLREVLTDYATF